MKISAADDSHLFWNLQPLIQRIIHCTHSHGIVEAENSVGLWLQAQKLAHGFCAALPGFDVSLWFANDVLARDFDSILREGAFVSFHPPGAGARFRSTNMRDSLATHVDQMLGCEQSHGFVIYANEICSKSGHRAIDQDVGRLLFFDAKEHINSRTAGRNN